jgi:hypothetical protein
MSHKLCHQWERLHEQRHAIEDKNRREVAEADYRAVEIAKANVERRLTEMNEMRAQINSERGQYVTREMYDKQYEALRETMDARLKPLETIIANYQGRMLAAGAIITFVLGLLQVGLHYIH